ncbi:MAG: hypothetical protein GF333_05095 [Candidatus Omnitrophica bacterium]|nr:hypothetical protein [Candidatus Omnitrophota bacterium]
MGFFGLNPQEKKIWESIEPGNKMCITLLRGRAESYSTTVIKADAGDLVCKIPQLGKISFEVPEREPVRVEVEVCNPRAGRIQFRSSVQKPHQEGRRVICVSKPRSLRWMQLRKHFRVEQVLNVEYAFVDPETGSDQIELRPPKFFALARNISEKGTFLITDNIHELYPGMHVDMQLSFPGKDQFKARGRIVRTEKVPAEDQFGVAIEFLRIEGAGCLAEFIEKKKQETAAI